MIATDQPTIFDPEKVRVVLSSRTDGNTRASLSSPQQAERAMSSLAAHVDLTLDRVVTLDVAANQQTWDEIVEVATVSERVAADALVTNVPGIGLLLKVADCNAVAVHDPVRNVLAIVHLGWQSTVADLATKIVQHLQHTFRSSAADLRVYVSPAIKAASYVFEDVSQADDPAWQGFLQKSDTGIGVDLPGFNRQRFIEAGVLPEHIQVSPIDTATSDNYFSHYRSARTGEPEGRFALLAVLKK